MTLFDNLRWMVNIFFPKSSLEKNSKELPTSSSHPSLNKLNRFQVARERVYNSNYYQPYFDLRHPFGLFHNKPIIGARTKISGGIFISAAPTEALFIEDDYHLMRPILNSFKSRIKNAGKFSIQKEIEILEEIFEVVDSALEWSPSKINKYNHRMGIGVDSKVALDVYLAQKIGVSRHKILLAAYLIEKLKEENILTGDFVLPELIRNSSGEDEYLIYTLKNGVFVTLDPSPEEGRQNSFEKVNSSIRTIKAA